MNVKVNEYVSRYKEILDVLGDIRFSSDQGKTSVAIAILHEVAKDERMKQMHGGAENAADSPGKFVYIYVPDGLRDRDFEALLKEKIPKSETPREDNIFWSNKYGNFVVKKEYAEQVESAIEEHYGKGSLVKDPSWAQKPNTWQVKSTRRSK